MRFHRGDTPGGRACPDVTVLAFNISSYSMYEVFFKFWISHNAPASINIFDKLVVRICRRDTPGGRACPDVNLKALSPHICARDHHRRHSLYSFESGGKTWKICFWGKYIIFLHLWPGKARVLAVSPFLAMIIMMMMIFWFSQLTIIWQFLDIKIWIWSFVTATWLWLMAMAMTNTGGSKKEWSWVVLVNPLSATHRDG